MSQRPLAFSYVDREAHGVVPPLDDPARDEPDDAGGDADADARWWWRW